MKKIKGKNSFLNFFDDFLNKIFCICKVRFNLLFFLRFLKFYSEKWIFWSSLRQNCWLHILLKIWCPLTPESKLEASWSIPSCTQTEKIFVFWWCCWGCWSNFFVHHTHFNLLGVVALINQKGWITLPSALEVTHCSQQYFIAIFSIGCGFKWESNSIHMPSKTDTNLTTCGKT